MILKVLEILLMCKYKLYILVHDIKKKKRGRKGKEIIIKKKSWRKVVSSPFQEEEEATSLTKENKEGV